MDRILLAFVEIEAEVEIVLDHRAIISQVQREIDHRRILINVLTLSLSRMEIVRNVDDLHAVRSNNCSNSFILKRH